jgi:hypothetical protein
MKIFTVTAFGDDSETITKLSSYGTDILRSDLDQCTVMYINNSRVDKAAIGAASDCNIPLVYQAPHISYDYV